jgi:soluble lytic murein transglycosylase-like protein
VVQAESAFDPAAVSPVGAQGLMQLMPTTATLMGVSDPFDARQNVFAGTKYLSQLLDRFDGDVALALAGYNAGPTRVARCRGIPPYRETRRYVAKIRDLLVESTGVAFPLPKPGLVGGRDGRRRIQRRA